MNAGPPFGIGLGLTQHLAADRRHVALAESEELEQVGDRVALGPPEVGVRHLAGAIADVQQQARDDHSLDQGEPIVFLEVGPADASDFTGELYVDGAEVGRHRILRCTSAAVPNAIAALLIHIRDRSQRIPHAYFGWTEGNPVTYVLKYLALGEGDTAPVTREVLRKTIANPLERPRIHVG